ncbi:MAG: acetyl ornithine aminotransferase family protein [Candidatus Hydrogenedentota bacterium]|nr:MAG: acetyl ornithine aminotransferase family protein [Candidatus Hydrogenedentota bacterium]GIX44132.1 MAG: acetylornithine aminotransferase [Candidatus Sumerlaea sp.]
MVKGNVSVQSVNELLPEIKVTPPGPKAKAVIERDHAIMSPSYTRDYGFVMERGEGCVVWDVDGNRYLDLAAGIAVCSTGHSHPKVVAAIQEQASKFLHMSGTDFYYEVQIRLAERLAKYAPISGPKRVFFTNSGAESIECAIKLARHHTRGHQMLAFYGSFHGRTMGALSLTSSKNIQRRNFGPFLSGVVHVDYQQPVELIERNVIKRVIDEGNFAAVFVEPIQGEGGYIVPSKQWLLELRELCTRYGIVLVADEVQCGMGRTGKMFACEHFGLEPDIICTAKGIASGLPLGAVIARADIMNWQPGQHASTFGGNPVACAAANATLDLLEESLMENASVVGAYLVEQLHALCQRVKILANPRGLGLMVGIDAVDKEGKPSPDLRNKIVTSLFYEGVLILGCGAHSIRFCPPLVLQKEQVDYAIAALERVCAKLQ